MKRTRANAGVQLSLFDDMREMSDSQLISELTNTDIVSDDWSGEYRLEKLFNSLTPQRRRVAMAAVELYKRRTVCRDKRKRILTSMDIFSEMKPLLCDLENEEFWVIALNHGNRVMDKIRISVGGMTQTAVDVRLVIRKLLEVGATAFAALHNHPSGNRFPSNEDRKITETLRNAGKLFNITMLDHLIIAHETYYSFSDEGIM